MGWAFGNAAICLELSKLIGYTSSAATTQDWRLIEQILYMFCKKFTVSILSELNL